MYKRFLQTSARAGSNVDAAFLHVCEQALDLKLQRDAAYRAAQIPSNAIPRSPADVNKASGADFPSATSGRTDSDADSVASRSSPPSVRLTHPPPASAAVGDAAQAGGCGC